MEPATYLGRISKIRNEPIALQNEQDHLQKELERITAEIRSRLTEKSVPGLIWHLATMEVRRVSELADMEISDFASQARYLRALCASVPIKDLNFSEDPKTDELLKLCDGAWWALFHREMLEDLKRNGAANRDSRGMSAGMMSLLSAIQGPLMYIENANDRVRRLFGSFSDEIIEPSIGLTVEETIRGFESIRQIVADRLESAFDLMEPAHSMWQECRKLANAGTSEAEIRRFIKQQNAQTNALESFRVGTEMHAQFVLFTADDFESTLCDRSAAFLDAFSFVAGNENAEFVTLFDEDVVRKRPFARLNDNRYLLFDVCYCAFAPLNRLADCFTTERQKQRLLKRRDDSLEHEAAKLFRQVVSPSLELRTYYIPVGPNGELAERDLVVSRDGIMFVVESKAKSLRSVAGHRGNLKKIEGDVKRSIQEGYDQASSVIEYFQAGNQVPVYDTDKPGAPIWATVDATQIHTYIPVVFLDSYFGLIATNLEPWLTVKREIGFPWVVDHDAMSAILLKIDTLPKLAEFVEWRRRLHGVAVNEDETVFAGFFLRHGPEDMPKNADVVQLDQNYSDIFEHEYFRRNGMDVPYEPDFVGKPVWSSTSRKGDEVEFQIQDQLVESINLQTGLSTKADCRKPQRVGRNEPCPCGSGLKYKKCCIRSPRFPNS